MPHIGEVSPELAAQADLPEEVDTMEPLPDSDDEGAMSGGNLTESGAVIDIPMLDVDESRDFMDQKKLFDDLSNILGIDNKRFEHLVETKFQQFKDYKSKEEFCRTAPVDQVLVLISAV